MGDLTFPREGERGKHANVRQKARMTHLKLLTYIDEPYCEVSAWQ